MANPSTIARGNMSGNYVVAVTLSPSSVANATSAEQTFTVTGLLLGDVVAVNKPAAQAGLGIVGSRVSANGVLAITFGNFTIATITPTASEVYSINVSRPENVASNVASLASVPT